MLGEFMKVFFIVKLFSPWFVMGINSTEKDETVLGGKRLVDLYTESVALICHMS